MRRQSGRRSTPDEDSLGTFGFLRNQAKRSVNSRTTSMARESSREIEHGSALPEFHDGGIVEVFLGGAFDIIVGFACGGSGGKGDAELIGEVEGEAEILVHEAQRETRDVFAFEEIGGFDVEHT